MVSPATKKADLGGIDTPPSANYLVVHNPAKCSVFWRSTQGHGEILFPFGNHPPPHPLFSLRSQTATSQLAGFRITRGLEPMHHLTVDSVLNRKDYSFHLPIDRFCSSYQKTTRIREAPKNVKQL